jgi:hypothetical protein
MTRQENIELLTSMFPPKYKDEMESVLYNIINRPIEEQEAHILSHLTNEDKKRIVIQEIEHYFDVTLESLRLPSRKRELVEVRQIFMYYLRKNGLTLQSTAALLGKDHSTAIHSIKQQENLIFTSARWRDIHTQINERIEFALSQLRQAKVEYYRSKHANSHIQNQMEFTEKIESPVGQVA